MQNQKTKNARFLEKKLITTLLLGFFTKTLKKRTDKNSIGAAKIKNGKKCVRILKDLLHQ